MPKFLKNWFVRMLVKDYMEKMKNGELKSIILTKLRNKVQLPNVTKEKEDEYFAKMYDVLVETLDDVLN